MDLHINMHKLYPSKTVISIRQHQGDACLANRKVHASILIWLQPQLCQRDEALHASAEGDKRAILLHACDIAMRALPDLHRL